jgi:hypothetical protein
MSWEFEHWDNGRVYLHNERWKKFRENIEKNGWYPHNWNHNRIFVQIHTPRDVLQDVPCAGNDGYKHKVERVEDFWSVVYEPYPAFARTEHDPEGWCPSWHLWAEDGHINPHSEQLTLIWTGHIWAPKDPNIIQIQFHREANLFARFQGKFWRVQDYWHYRIGPNPPPPGEVKLKKKKLMPRDIFEEFQSPW